MLQRPQPLSFSDCPPLPITAQYSNTKKIIFAVQNYALIAFFKNIYQMCIYFYYIITSIYMVPMLDLQTNFTTHYLFMIIHYKWLYDFFKCFLVVNI